MLGLYVLLVAILLGLMKVDAGFILGVVVGMVILKDIFVFKRLMNKK